MPKQHLPHLTGTFDVFITEDYIYLFNDHIRAGVRFLASLWIVCNHFVPKSPPSSLDHVRVLSHLSSSDT
jgi:hypothetical protein